MVNTLPIPKSLVLNTWVTATWAEFLAASEHAEIEKSNCYYDAGWMRIETMPIGFAHGKDNSTLAAVITLYGTMRSIPFMAVTNTSFRKSGKQECQPDLAFYIGSELPTVPRSNSPINVDEQGAPTLVIEIVVTTLSDDLGQKRLLYERLGVQEYWVVNVELVTVIAFAVQNGGSRQIQDSQVLPGLAIALIEAALRRSQTEDDGTINRWLMQIFPAIA